MQLSIQASLLNVSDLDRSIAFYQDVLELKIVSRWRSSCRPHDR